MSRSRTNLRDLRPERVCLIKPSSLGDVVHALPVLAALRDRWPSARFTWVIGTGLAGLVEGHPFLDGVVRFERSAMRPTLSGARALGRFLRALRRDRFDVAIDLQGLFRSGFMAQATGAPVRVGLATAREGATRFYTHRVPPAPDRPHAVDVLLAVAEAFGADITRPRFVVALSEEDRRWAKAALEGVDRPRLVLNLGARWPTKRWPVEHFARVARWAFDGPGVGLAVVGASEDRPLVEAFRAHLDGRAPFLDLCGGTSLPRLAAVAAESDLFLSNDTGPLHLACAVGARAVGIYTCTRPEWTGPYGPNAVAVQTAVPCAGSCVRNCERLDCMRELDAERVWRVVRDRLDAVGRNVVPAA